jgi:hypothetical protein
MFAKDERDIKLAFEQLKYYEDYLGGLPEGFKEWFNEIVHNQNLNTRELQLGYFENNVEIAKLVPKDKIVIDVGCGFGFQHLLYKDHAGWIGIQKFRENNIEKDYNIELKVFTDNAKIIQDEFKDIGEKLVIGDKDKYFGIANHSLWHDLERNKEDIELFQRLFPHNYYVTDEGGKLIKY